MIVAIHIGQSAIQCPEFIAVRHGQMRREIHDRRRPLIIADQDINVLQERDECRRQAVPDRIRIVIGKEEVMDNTVVELCGLGSEYRDDLVVQRCACERIERRGRACRQLEAYVGPAHNNYDGQEDGDYEKEGMAVVFCSFVQTKTSNNEDRY